MPLGNTLDLLLRITGDDRDARQKLRGLATELDAFARIHASAEATVEVKEAQARLDVLKKELDELDGATYDANVSADIEGARANIKELELQLEKLDHTTYSPNIDVDRSQLDTALHGLSGLADNIKRLASASQGAEKETKSFFDRLGGTGVNIGPFTTQLRTAVPVVLALSGVVSALAGALAALVASAAAAAGGLVAIGIAGAAALGPVGALLIGVVSKVTQASQAQKNYKTAQDAVKSSSDQLRQAQDSVSQAQLAATRSTQDLTRARKDAADQIRTDLMQAENGLRSAQEGLSAAEFQAKTAEEALTQARIDARRALVDEQLAAESTALSHKAAVLNLRQARATLAAGAPDSLTEAQNRLAVQEAELQVTQTRVASGRAQRDLTRSEKLGVSGAPGVVSARRALHDANQSVTDSTVAMQQAQLALNKAQAASVATAPQVVNAEQQVADAHHAVAQAQQAEAKAAADLAEKQKAAAKARRVFQSDRAALDLQRALNPIQRTFGKAVDEVIKGMARGLRSLAPLLRKVGPSLIALGKTMGKAFQEVTKEFAKPAWQRFFTFLLRSSRQLVPLMTKGFIAFLRILRNVIKAAMPFLLDGMKKFVGFLQDVARDSKGVNLDLLMGNLKTWVRLMFEVGRLLLVFVEIAAGPGRKLVSFLARGAQAMADWLNTKEGQRSLRLFFSRTLPLAKDLAVFVGRLFLLFLQLGEIMAPILDVIVKPLNILLGLLNKLTEFLIVNTGGWKNWSKVISVAVGIVTAVFSTPIFIGTQLLNHWKDIRDGLVSVWRGIAHVAGRVWGLIRDIITGTFRGMGHVFENMWGGILGVLKQMWGVIKTVATHIWGAIRTVIMWQMGQSKKGLTTLFGGMLDVATRIWGAIRDVAKVLWGSISRGIVGSIKPVYSWLRDATHTLGKVFAKIWGGIVDVVQGALHVIHDAVHGIVQAINFIVDKLGSIKDKISGAIPSLPGGGGFNPLSLIPDPGGIASGAANALNPFNYSGGVVRRPGYFAGEEAPRHPEVIIPENPAYRGRAMSLWQTAGAMLGIPGFAKGGVRYALPWPGGTSQFGELDRGIDVGGTGPVYAMDSGVVTRPNFNLFSTYGSSTSGLVYKMDHPPQGYAPSSPYVYIYELFAPDPGAHGRIKAGQLLGHITGGSGIEMGWAANGSGTPLADALGENIAARHSLPRGLATSISLQDFIAAIQAGHPISSSGAGGLAQLIKLKMPKIGGVPGPAKAIAEGGVKKMIDAANQYLTKVERPLLAPTGTSSAGGVPYISGGQGSVVQQIARILMAQGFDSRAAAGIIGNAYRESLWNPGAVGTGGGGLWGFTTSPISLADLQSYANSQGKPWTDVGIQTQFMLQHGGLALRSALNAQKSAAGATRLFEEQFERAGIVAMDERISGAKAALAIIKKMGHAATGIRNFHGGPLMVGEKGPEVMWTGPGTNVEPLKASNIKLVVKGDIVSSEPDPVEAVINDKRFPVAVDREIAGVAAESRRHRRMRR